MPYWFMKFVNYVIAFVSTFQLIFNVHPVDRAPGEKIDTSEMSLVFADEFDGEALDTSVWGPHGRGVRRGGYWSMDLAEVRDGDLHIYTQYLEDGEYGPGWYTAGIDTRKGFMNTYGYYECRCKLPKGVGLWSAFWLMNGNVSQLTTGDATLGAEIDIYESPYYGQKAPRNRCVTSNIHYNGYELKTRYHNVGLWLLDNDPYENFNTYGMRWTEEGYTFYINGLKVGFTDYGGVSTKDEYMILSCEVDGDSAIPGFGWSGRIEDNDKSTFKADFVVDYVRVYK